MVFFYENYVNIYVYRIDTKNLFYAVQQWNFEMVGLEPNDKQSLQNIICFSKD